MKISDKFLVSNVAGENVILPIDNECVDYNSVFMLNETGMFIVSCMPASREEILEKILETYDISREDASVHLDDFLREIASYGMLED